MGLLERIRTGKYVPDAGPAIVAPGRRFTLSETGRRIESGEDAVSAVRDFLDQAGRADTCEISAMIADRPKPTGDLRADALLAGVAEYTAGLVETPCPAWVSEPGRFLDRFWFVGTEPAFRAIAIAQSPVALKRRGILWPSRSLRRV